jgi:UMF1 family MFS transporter
LATRVRISKLLKRRPLLAWAVYDWANSAFATTVMAGFFPLFYGTLSEPIGTASSQFWFNVTLAASSVALAIAAPLLGAVADCGGARKQFLAVFAGLGVLMTAAMAWIPTGQWWIGLLLYGFGTIGFSGANVFYDSMLVDVAEEEEFDLASSIGYSAGYIGGGLLFALNVLVVLQPQWFGLSDAAAAVRVSFVTVALWWAVFTVPLLWLVRESRTKQAVSRREAIRTGLMQLKLTVKEIRSFRILLLFLLAYWIYIDGVNTVIKTAVFFGGTVLGLPSTSLVTALLVTQFVAFPAALAFGWFGTKVGAKTAILCGLGVYFGVLVFAWYGLDTVTDFYVLAIVVGLVQGGVQSLSRSLYARLIPASKTAEFFGFFNMVGKFASIFGPMLIAVTPFVVPAAGVRDAILSLTILFVVGGLLLSRVRVEEGVEVARAFDKRDG